MSWLSYLIKQFVERVYIQFDLHLDKNQLLGINKLDDQFWHFLALYWNYALKYICMISD